MNPPASSSKPRRAPLRRRKPLRRTKLRRVSQKRSNELAIYYEKRVAFLKDKYCEWPEAVCFNRAFDVHHMHGRHGDNLLDERWWMALCREHHTFLHNHARAARLLGLLK